MMRFFKPLPALLVALAVYSGCGSAERAVRPAQTDPSVVAVIGDETLTLNEFEARYARSVGGADAARQDSLAELKDFLNRYVDFRLKVHAAEAAGLSDDPAIQAEVAQYRDQLAQPYLMEQEVMEPLQRALYGRLKEAVNTSHILVRVQPDASPQDTLAAYNRAVAIRDSVLAGADFGDLAERLSEDPSAQAQGQPGYRGELGVIPAGRAVGEFEDMAYNTPVGAVSPVFRSQFGYHLLRVNSRKPASPERRVAHIMIIPASPSAADSLGAIQQLEDLRSRALAGEDFGALAKQYSQHQQSGQQGGDLGFYLSADIEQGAPEGFKEAAFALKNEGDISDVVVTPFGMHLIKLLEIKEIGSYESMRDELKGLLARMPRTREAQSNFIKGVFDRNALAIDTAAVVSIFGSVPADSLLPHLRRLDFADADLSRQVVSLGDSAWTVLNVAEFAAASNVPYNPDLTAQVTAILDAFAASKAMPYAMATLENEDAEFARIMQEYRDGMLLFRLMEDSVWTAASQDSAALEAYYAAHAAEYNFGDRTRVVTFYSGRPATLEQVGTLLGQGYSPEEVLAEMRSDSLLNIRVDTTYLSGATNSVFDRALSLSEGQYTEPLQNQRGYILLLNAGTDAARPQTFAEARAEVVADYQEVLEKALMERLRNATVVRTYPEHLANAFAGQQDESGAVSASR